MASREDQHVEVENVTLGHETEKAIRVFFPETVNNDEGEEHWVPLSQVTKMVRGKTKGSDKITIAVWFARKIGIPDV